MTIYIIYDCDEWKSRASMRFICAARKEALKEALNQIKDAREYTDEEMKTYIFIDTTELL